MIKVTRAFYFGEKSYRWFLLPPSKLLPNSGHSTMSVARWKAAPSCASIFAGACVSYSESARRKQLSVTFPTHACPQSCTVSVRFCQDLHESTHRIFFGAACTTPKMELSQTTLIGYSKSVWRKQPSNAFPTRGCPQSCTVSVCFHKDLCESTHRFYWCPHNNKPKLILFTYVRYAYPRSLSLQSHLPHYLKLAYLVTQASSRHT